MGHCPCLSLLCIVKEKSQLLESWHPSRALSKEKSHRLNTGDSLMPVYPYGV